MSITNKTKELVGRVVSAKMQKSVIVAVPYTYSHPIYKKALRRTRRFAAHVVDIKLEEGDEVVIAESRKYSKTKAFVVLRKKERI